jgi:phosphoribosylformimino-5-aminoimidazole carboxamide ribotide isomerase
MIIPSIDMMDGQAVQLVGGDKNKKEIEAGDPMPIAKRFALAGDIAVIDLDAALGSGSNEEIIADLCSRFRCRVGGGIRDLDGAVKWLDAGAKKIIIGTSATPELLGRLPRERVIAALDARHGEVVVEGWQKGTGRGIIERVAELKEYVSGFLVTLVEGEGRMAGIDMKQVASVVEAAKGVRVTVAGGVSKPEEIAEIDRLGADVQVGMALYSGKLELADGIAAPLKSDRDDGLWPTVVVDEFDRALGLCYSNRESLAEAVRTMRGVYHSRSRGLWVKGLTSGNTQELKRIDLDCDRDTLRFVVSQGGDGFCHNDTWTCWGEDSGLPALFRVLASRAKTAPKGSYTNRLLNDPELLNSKILEEAGELTVAESKEEVAGEAADVIYFTLAAMVRAQVDLKDVEQVLRLRSLKVTRRPGNAKPKKKVF